MSLEQAKFDFMKLALMEAEKAALMAEVPIGAVIVKEGEVIARAHNLRESSGQPSAHAELLAIQSAAKELGQWRLIGCDLYTTLEPCMMCYGAISLARIRSLYFAATDFKAGVCGGRVDLKDSLALNHWPRVEGGFYEAESVELLSQFFRDLRKKEG